MVDREREREREKTKRDKEKPDDCGRRRQDGSPVLGIASLVKQTREIEGQKNHHNEMK